MIKPELIDKLIDVEKIPIESAKRRRELVVEEKKEIEKLHSLINELDVSLNGLKGKTDFYKMKVDSSHPDIIEGVVEGAALLGSYEFEIRGVAKAEKELAYGFPDKDETPVGFGYMLVEREDGEPAEITIEPGATLQDVANIINEQEAGVKAMVINTKYQPDPYRLLVISEKSGKEASVYIDEDTTFLEFKEQVTGRNLDVLFEDVPITDEDNTLDELLDGVVFFIKRSEPGTRVQVAITYDLDATMENIKSFVEKYNNLVQFIHNQFVVSEETGRAGKLAADGSIKMIMRQLQQTLIDTTSLPGKFRTLADIGITTNPKTGTLDMNEAKVKQSLAEDYDGVASLFVRSKQAEGAASRLAEKVKVFRDPNSGAIKSRLRGLDQIIKNQDSEIERKERHLQQREEEIKRKFAALDGQLVSLQQQGNFLTAKFGSEQGQGGPGPG